MYFGNEIFLLFGGDDVLHYYSIFFHQEDVVLSFHGVDFFLVVILRYKLQLYFFFFLFPIQIKLPLERHMPAIEIRMNPVFLGDNFLQLLNLLLELDPLKF